MAWYVFTENELSIMVARGGEELVDRIRDAGRRTENDTILVNPSGPDATKITAAFSKLPRRMARDAPTDTSKPAVPIAE